MKAISEREFRNNFAAVMEAVEGGETCCIIRNGVEIAELRPLRRRRELTSEDLVALLRDLPRVHYEEMRREADEFFDDDDRITGDASHGEPSEARAPSVPALSSRHRTRQ